MSLTDRNRTHSAPAAYLPAAPTGPTPTGPAPGGPKPYRHLVLLAVGLIVLAVVLAVIAYGLTRPTASSDPGTGPSAAIPSAVQTPAPTPTPTLTDREQLALAASNGYKAYIAAYDRAGNAGGVDKLPKYLTATVDGPMAKTVLTDLKQVKAGGFAGSGSAVAYTRVDALGELTDKVPSAKLATCVDQTGKTVTKNGKPFAGKPQYIRGQFTMHRVGGVWKVYSGTSQVWKGGDCLAALGPTAR